MSLSLSFIKAESKQGIQKSLNTVLNTTQETLQLWLSSRLGDLKELARDKEMIALAKVLISSHHNKPNDQKNSPALEKMRTLMAAKMQRYNDKGFFIINPDRVSIASMRDANISSENLINQQRKLYLDRAFMGDTLFIPSINSDVPLITQSGALRDKQPTIFIASPIIDHNAKVIAVLTLRLDPMTNFSRITQLGRIGNTGETYAFDESGQLLTKSRFTEDLRAIGVIRNDEIDMLSIRVIDPGGNLLEGYKPETQKKDWPLTLMAHRAIEGNTSSFIDSYRDYRGVEVFGAWLWSKKLGIGLTTEIDVKEALQPYELTRMVIIIVLAILIVLTIGLVFFLLWLQEREKKVLKQHSKLLKETVFKRTAELEDANKNLKILSEIDPLTQIGNRRLYEQTLPRAIATSKRASQAMSLMIIDIDFFKPFNDNYGHHQGDVTLYHVAEVIANSLTRTTDLAARYGGEEFVVLMPSTDAEGALYFANQIKTNIESRGIKHKFSSVADIVTVSIGVASLVGDALNGTDLFRDADNALYQAKENGRKQIVLYQSLRNSRQ